MRFFIIAQESVGVNDLHGEKDAEIHAEKHGEKHTEIHASRIKKSAGIFIIANPLKKAYNNEGNISLL